jgi:2',3'-cyclic-nucleotide 2'-phosphodiesterase (5'-nucleotidase family)
MKYEPAPTNEKICAAVRQYVDSILDALEEKSVNYNDIEVSYDYASNKDETQSAIVCDIQTEFGFVTVFPDFKEENAKASLFNIGMVRSMELEGFDDDIINNAPAYGTLMPYSEANVDIFAKILSEDLGLQHQKML